MTRTLRSKRLRAALYHAANGKCQLCGCELGEDWHADHIVPWVLTRRTNVHEMQALCPACNLSKGVKVLSSSVFTKSAGFREQRGQAVMWAAAEEVDLTVKNRFFAHLCTGYGKTLLAYGMFAILRERGLVDCMLALVPGDDQRCQFVDDANDAELLLGIQTSPLVSEKAAREIIGVRDGKVDVLAATYQQLNDGHFNDTFAGKKLFLVADECHHLAKVWGANAAAIHREATLFLTATPMRSDEKALIGVPAKPDVQINYAEAYEEKVVRRIYGEIDHFSLKVKHDGKSTEITTADLVSEGVKDFSAYEAKKKLRYDDSYLDWMLLSPLQELQHRNASQPGQHQMIVFAMSCKHADHISRQLQKLCDTVGFDFTAAWVGVGEGLDGSFKTDAENREIVDSYKKGSLDILVQVDKAGEGFSVKRASVLVFVHLIGFDGKLLQQIGRGIRRNDKIPFGEDNCVVFASADTDIARLIVEMEQQVREVDEANGSNQGEPRQPSLFDIPDRIDVRSEHERTEFVGGVLSESELELCKKYGVPESEYLETASGRRKRATTPPKASQRASLETARADVNRATSTLCGNIISIMRRSGEAVDKTTAGRIKGRINAQWIADSNKSHGEMLKEDFDAKYRWLQSVNRECRETRKAPSWLR